MAPDNELIILVIMCEKKEICLGKKLCASFLIFLEIITRKSLNLLPLFSSESIPNKIAIPSTRKAIKKAVIANWSPLNNFFKGNKI